MPDSDIQRLVERIEGASEGSQGALLEDAWETLAAASASFRQFACDHCSGFGTNAGKFSAALEARAFESAALMLVPSEFYIGRLHQWVADNFRWACDLARKDMTGGKRISAEDCAMPALAIAAAALRARITERTDDE